MNLSHLLYGIFDTARYPISDDDIGSTELENPSPNWNASTDVCLDIPTRSETGTISGIVTAAIAPREADAAEQDT